MKQYLTMKDICNKTGFSSAGIYLQIRRGVFVPPQKWGRVSRWREDEVQKVLTAREQSKTDDEIKVIVSEIIREREQQQQAA